MPEQLVDQILKKMSEYHADAFIRLAFPGTSFKILTTKLEKELIFKTRLVDTVVKIVAGAKEHLIHFEFQTDYDTKIAERIFIYAGALTAKYKLPVSSILFQIKPPPKKVTAIDRYDVSLVGILTNSFRFHVVKLWEYADEIISGKKDFRAFIPLLLELTPNPTEAVLEQQRELIQQEEDFSQKTELLSYCMALATRHFSFEFLKEFFKEDAAMIKEWEQVPYIGERIKSVLSESHEKGIKEGMKEGMKEGIKEGMKSGIQKGIRENIIEVLENRFRSVNGVKDMISSIEDIDRLKRIFRLSLTIESFEAFKDTISKMKDN